MISNGFEINFQQEAFERAYAMLENGLYAETIVFGVRVPLHGIALESDEVILDDDLAIRKIDKDDFENLVLSLDFRSFIRSPNSPALSAVAVVTQRQSRKVSQLHQQTLLDDHQTLWTRGLNTVEAQG